MSINVIVIDQGPVRLIRMNRPDKKNALTSAMYDGMAQAIESASGDSPIRCIVIAGVPGAFSAGNDLGDFMKAATGGEGLGNSVLAFSLFAGARGTSAGRRRAGRRGRHRHHDDAALRLCGRGE